ncbi:HlyD family secretion protein [Janthinobacterium sp. RB2R34]|uniref:HlyD family secretion protein n=1 Tax=Janthinobacterium sp. RB2R34 TaxID=3424193 RepID=UPI003F276718
MSLFRAEVYERRTKQWLGTIQLARPISFAVVCFFSLVLLVLTVIFLIKGDFTRKARLAGILVPVEGTATLTAPGSGIIKEIRAREGDIVESGGVVLVIDTERQSIVDRRIGSDTALAAVQIASREKSAEDDRANRIAITNQRDLARLQQIRNGEAEIGQIDEEILLQERRVNLVTKMLERYRKLKDDGFFTEVQLQAKQDEELDLNAHLISLERSRIGLVKNREAMQAEQKTSQIELMSELSQSDRTLSSLRQERIEMLSRRTAVITAPGNGRIAGLSVQVGQSVREGQSLGTVIPVEHGMTTLQAQLYAPSKTVGFVQLGQQVHLRYAAYPYKKFGLYQGTVKGISTTPFAVNELPTNLSQQVVAQSGNNEALYRIDVTLEKQEITVFDRRIALKPGLALEGDVRQETRKLWELLFEPLLSVKAQAEAR